MHYLTDIEFERLGDVVARLLNRLVADREPEWLGISRPAMWSREPHLRIVAQPASPRERVKPAGSLGSINAAR